MLRFLSVKNFAVVKNIEIDFSKGLTVVTGETGAGKSIAVDALNLCIGMRADASVVRDGTDKAVLNAQFNIGNLPSVFSWLIENELIDKDGEHECVIRRVISAEGRSKAFINGSVVTLMQLKKLGAQLISIHGQHAHHALLKESEQKRVLDGYANNQNLLCEVAKACQEYYEAKQQLYSLKEQFDTRNDRRELLKYQIQELDEFGLTEHEFIELETEHKKLSHSQTLLKQAQKSSYQLFEADDFNALSVIKNSEQALAEMVEHDSNLENITELLSQSSIQLEEAAQELKQYCEQMNIDPKHANNVEIRYSECLNLSRKHQVQPEQLFEKHMELITEFKEIGQDESEIERKQIECSERLKKYSNLSDKLSEKRIRFAVELSQKIQESIQALNMPQAKVIINVSHQGHHEPQANGQDTVEIQMSANLGQKPAPLDSVVSGGELSRIGLAIQVITSNSNQIPTLVFDEVDTGISGATASIVGNLLRQLGDNGQVLCVTHLPQVASHGHNQLFVVKESKETSTETQIFELTCDERVNEIARLLAGDQLTETAIANAKELLVASTKN